MFPRLAQQIRAQQAELIDLYDDHLCLIPGYANLPQAVRHDLESHILDLMAQAVEDADDSALIQYVYDRAKQVLALGFKPEWFQEAVAIPEKIVTPLAETVPESNFVWRSLNRTQNAAWHVLAEERRRMEAGLRENEEQYRNAIVATGAVPYYIDYQTESYRFIGREIEHYTGYPAHEITPTLLGEMIQETIMTGQDSGLSRATAIEKARSGQAGEWKADYRLIDRQGHTRWLSDASVQVLDEQSKPIGAMGILQDITERKLAEEIVREAEARQRNIFNALPLGIHLYEVQPDGQLVFTGANSTADRMLGMDNSIFVGKAIEEAFPPLVETEVPQRYREAALTGQAWQTKQISYHEGKVQGAFEVHAFQTEPGHMAAAFLDIGERLRAEDALQQYAAIVESSAEAIFSATPDGKILSWNPAAEQMLGYPADEIIGQSVRVLAPPDRMAEAKGILTQLAASKHVKGLETVRVAKNGERIDVSLTASPIADKTGKIIALSAMLTDITERLRLEREVQESLERRGRQVQTSTEVAQEIAAAPALDELFQRVVTLIKERFGYYHAQIFRYEPVQDAVVLVTGYGPVGEKMRAAGHHLPMGRGVVGVAAATGKSILAPDVAADKDWRPNPNLPDTQAELAVPIKLRDEVLGILDVQSEQVGTLTQEDQLLLEGLCGQIAVAIESTRLLEQMQLSQAQFRTLVEYAPEAILVLDTDTGHFQDPNGLALRLFGLDREALIQVGPLDMSPDTQPDGRPSAEAALVYIADALNGGTPVFEWTHRNAAGQLIPCEIRLVRMPAAERNLLRVSINDITERMAAEEEVRHTQHFLDSVLENLPIMVFVKEAQDLRFVRWNKAGEELVGFSNAEMVGKNDYDFFPKAEADFFTAKDREVLNGKVLVDTPEEPIQTRHRGLRLLHTRKIPILDDKGNPQYLLGISEDITERQLTEEAVRRSEAQLSEALKIAKLAYWEYDVEQDLFLFNDQFYALFHTTAEQAGGYQISSAQYAGTFVYPDDLPLVGGEIERALNSTDRRYSRDLVHRILYADGGVGYISVNINIDRDEQGKILRYYGANQDITERKQTEIELAHSAQLLRTIMQTVPDYVYIKNTRSEFLVASQALAKILHLASPDEMIGKTDFDFFPPELAEKFYHDEQAIIQSGQPMLEEEPSIDTEGQVLWVSTTKVPFHNLAGEIDGIVGVGRDITERRQAEERLAAERNLFRVVIDTVPDMIYAKDLNNRFIIANRATAERRDAATPDDLIGKSDRDFYPPELAERYNAAEQTIMRENTPVIGLEEPSLDSDGKEHWHSSTKVPLRDPQGEVIGLVGITTDITERIQSETERERILVEQQKRARQLQAVSEVARAASSILKLDDLLPQTAELIRDHFELYYAGIFLLDDSNQWAMLRAGTGAAGQQMLADGHRLKIGSTSMISRCITRREAQIALDVGETAVRFDNPLLPLTRSEMALPLISRGKPTGALTIQSERMAAFTPDDITVLQTLADQISTAIDNAALYEQAQTALQEVDAINRRLTGDTWEAYLRGQVAQGVISAADDAQAAPEVLTLLDPVLTTGEVVVEPDQDNAAEATVTAPILLRGQPIGALRMKTATADWNQDLEAVLTDLAGHVAQAVENARLIEQTQRAASRERAINEINARVRQNIDLDSILRTAVMELGQTLKAGRVVARVGAVTPAESQPANDGNGRGEKHD